MAELGRLLFLAVWQRGPGHPDPEIRGVVAVSKKFFSALRASTWAKNEGEGPAPHPHPPPPHALPLDPPLDSVAAFGRWSLGLVEPQGFLPTKGLTH